MLSAEKLHIPSTSTLAPKPKRKSDVEYSVPISKETMEANLEKALRREAQLKDELMTDELTKILNRKGLNQKEEEFIENGQAYAVFNFDINSFKKINDTLGHKVGDQVLVHTALQFITMMPEEYFTPGRNGGDEFIILCPLNPEPGQTVEDVFNERKEFIDQKSNEITDSMPHLKPLGYGVAWGGSFCDPNNSIQATPDEMRSSVHSEADHNMYLKKQEMGGGR